MHLRDKKILLISPNEWGKMFISKHHYAIELARLGNDVFFLNPPDYTQKQYIKIEKHSTISNLTIITYRPFLPFFLRFHARRIYDFLLRFELRHLTRSIGLPMDIVWCFETNLYGNLTYFNAKEKIIFHPVDQVKYDYQIKIGGRADIILSVSTSILDKFSQAIAKKKWINHGLGADFVQMALTQDLQKAETRGPLKVGYVGNLLNSTIDTKTILRIVATVF